MPRRALLAALAVLVSPGPALASDDCPSVATCATITVPLDHTGATPGTLPLTYARIPATGTKTGTLVWVSGGPGQAAIPFARAVATRLRSLREHYDLVFPDQRGSGRSGAVKCGLGSDAAVAVCAGKLGDRRAHFTTPETALDLEDLRRALDDQQLMLLATSYGTMVAEEYARRFPAQVSGLILDSPVSPDGVDVIGVDFVPALSRVLRALCVAECRRTLGDPVAVLARVVQRLRHAPVRGHSVTRAGDVRPAMVTEENVFDALESADVSIPLRLELPAAIASLAHGDPAPFLHAYALWVLYDRRGPSTVNFARQVATLCAEAPLPWAPDSPLDSRAAAERAFGAGERFAPFSSETAFASWPAPICRVWPPTPRPVPAAGTAPDVPILVLSGRDDTRTPLEGARRVAANYSRATLVDVPYAGHAVLSSDQSRCALRAVQAFTSARPILLCNRLPRAERPQRLALEIYRPANVGSLEPFVAPGRVGATLHAAYATLNVAFRDRELWASWYGLSKRVRLPGLRGGFVVAYPGGFEMHGAEAIRGVRVSGRFSINFSGHLVVSGPGAAGGTLAFRRGDVVGMLGGRKIHDRN